ncbi:hypothetical protein Tco_0182131 [Tanacetum coccineum]
MVEEEAPWSEEVERVKECMWRSRRVEQMSSTWSKFMVRGEECLEGCIGASGGEVNGGGDDFGVSKGLLGEIPGVAIEESDGETFRVNEGTVWYSVGGDSVWYGGDFGRGLLKQQGR